MAIPDHASSGHGLATRMDDVGASCHYGRRPREGWPLRRQTAFHRGPTALAGNSDALLWAGGKMTLRIGSCCVPGSRVDVYYSDSNRPVFGVSRRRRSWAGILHLTAIGIAPLLESRKADANAR